MRQGQQQNRQRSRGRNNNNNRNNNNRNQLNRSMESNGPEVRIRGTAAHIAEKYVNLANDAQTAGDTVAAQSYWQFAEHYNRLVAAAQAQQETQREEQRAAREARGESDDDGDENRSDNRGEGRGDNRGRSRRSPRRDHEDQESETKGGGPQPKIDGEPAEVAFSEKAGKPADKAEDADGLEEKPKPRRAKRPKKTEETAGTTSDDDAAGLPAFVTGD